MRVTLDLPSSRSSCLTIALTAAGDLAAARHAGVAGLAGARAAGDQGAVAESLIRMAMLDLRAARAEDAAACLREALQIADRAGLPLAVDNALNCCGSLCAATGRHLEAVTVWAAADAFWKEFAGGSTRSGAPPP